jgi:hypothetical protein
MFISMALRFSILTEMALSSMLSPSINLLKRVLRMFSSKVRTCGSGCPLTYCCTTIKVCWGCLNRPLVPPYTYCFWYSKGSVSETAQ